MTTIIEAKKTLEIQLLGKNPRVTGIGLSQDRRSIIVYVEASEGYCDSTGIPSSIYGFNISISCLDRVMPGNPLFSPQSNESSDSTEFCSIAESTSGQAARERYRPICGGISAAHYRVGAGTLGAVLKDAMTGQPLLLSNNHVFANMSTTRTRRALKGDPILQPSPVDGGCEADVVGYLERWIPYDTEGANLVDAAVARPAPGILTSEVILGDGEFITPTRMVSITGPTRVWKFGRTGGMTQGEIIDWDFATIMPYPCGIQVKYTDQLLIKMNTCAGDSGSIYLDQNSSLVGLHAGGSSLDGTLFAVANKIRNVAALLSLEIF